MTKVVKVGLFGVGHLGKIHARLLKEIAGYEVVGFFDPQDAAAQLAATEFGLQRFENQQQLIDAVQAVVIAAPTLAHFDIATAALRAGKHIFVEKPVTETTLQAKKLTAMAEEAGVKAMVGHVERFNPAMLAIDAKKINPVFIEVHRLAQFNPRGTDVSVVHDLMIHDLDIILGLVKSQVCKVSASGVAIISSSLDIANARIEFTNGCVANVTASRISLKNMRKMRVFQPGAYIGIDFLKGKSDVLKMHHKQPSSEIPSFEIDFGDKKKFITMETLSKQDVNAIKLELEMFHKSITQNKPVPVSVEDGFKAMQLAQKVMDAIEKHAGGVKMK
jgi:predicted dehydrogenase